MKTNSWRSVATLAVLSAAAFTPRAVAQFVVPGGTVGNSGSGNVGIGTSAPGSKLDVIGNIHATDGISLGDGHWSVEGTAYTALSTFGGAVIRGDILNVGRLSVGSWTQDAPFGGFAVAGDSVFSGRVGVGTVAPTSRFHVFDGTGVGAGLLVQAGFPFGAGVYPSVLKLKDKDGAYELFNVNSDGSFFFNRGPDRVITGTPSGNVGVGTLAPSERFEVSGQLSSDGPMSQDRAFNIKTAGGNRWKIGIPAAWVEAGANGGGDLGFLRYADNGGYLGAAMFLQRSTGNVGIGLASPDARLTVMTPSRGTDGLAIYRSGGSFLRAAPDVDPGNWTGLTQTGDSAMIFSAGAPNSGGFVLAPWNSSNAGMRMTAAGNVGIGTANPTNKLEVNGTIRTKEVIVETNGWADHVLAKGYPLAPLSEVEAHIAANGTLPGIPSAADVAAKGVSVGDMQAKLLAKLEELTLHQIAQEKRITQLAAENAQLKRAVTELQTAR